MSSTLSLGLLAGLGWNAASLWVMGRLLHAWLGPSPRRGAAIGWLLLKLAVIYPMAWLLLSHPAISLVGFSLGFTLALFAALIWFAARARQFGAPHPHGR